MNHKKQPINVLGLHEYRNTAAGMKALDAMVKVAPVAVVDVRIVNPGKLVVLITGDVASVEAALKAARNIAETSLLDELFLANLHPDIVPALGRANPPDQWEALAIVDTASIAAGIRCADTAAKRANIRVAAIRIDDSMGGRASVRIAGEIGEVEIAIEAVQRVLEAEGSLVHATIIPRLSSELRRYVYDGSLRISLDRGSSE